MNSVDQDTLEIFDRSLRRCNANPGFLDLFYETFLASSPKVREKFANTDFDRQKRLLHASFYLILLASEDFSRRLILECSRRESTANEIACSRVRGRPV